MAGLTDVRCFQTHPRLSPQVSDICFGCADILLEHTRRAVCRHTAVCPDAQAVLDADEAEMQPGEPEDNDEEDYVTEVPSDDYDSDGDGSSGTEVGFFWLA